LQPTTTTTATGHFIVLPKYVCKKKTKLKQWCKCLKYYNSNVNRTPFLTETFSFISENDKRAHTTDISSTESTEHY